MCDRCVMDQVKRQMLSRRSFFRASAGAGAAAVIGSQMARPAMAANGGEVVDLTHTYDHDFPTYFGEPQLTKEQLFKFESDGFNLFQLTVNEHTGTHIDAPLHFSADGTSVDEIALSDLVAPLVVIDIAAKAAENPDSQVTPEDLKAWIDANGDIPDGACVAMHSGWAQRMGDGEFRNADADGKMHFPGFHVDAANMLMEETGARSIAVDTLSLDFGMSPDFATHYAWLPSGRYGIEALAGLDQVPAAGATIIVGAPKHRGGSGGPARIFAMV